jgi:hypothetical protein
MQVFGVRPNGWEKLVRPYFDFLKEYDFSRATQFDRSDSWESSVVYASAHHAVRVIPARRGFEADPIAHPLPRWLAQIARSSTR